MVTENLTKFKLICGLISRKDDITPIPSKSWSIAINYNEENKIRLPGDSIEMITRNRRYSAKSTTTTKLLHNCTGNELITDTTHIIKFRESVKIPLHYVLLSLLWAIYLWTIYIIYSTTYHQTDIIMWANFSRVDYTKMLLSFDECLNQ